MLSFIAMGFGIVVVGTIVSLSVYDALANVVLPRIRAKAEAVRAERARADRATARIMSLAQRA